MISLSSGSAAVDCTEEACVCGGFPCCLKLMSIKVRTTHEEKTVMNFIEILTFLMENSSQ